MTYTVARLPIPPAAFAEIKARIDAVNQNGDYDRMFMRKGLDGPITGIDMTHIAVEPDEHATPTLDATMAVFDALMDDTPGKPNSHFVLGDETTPDLQYTKYFVERLARLGYSVVRT